MVVIAGVLRSHMRGVADERDVGLQLLGICREERDHARARRFLLALEQHGEVDRQPAGHRHPGARRLDEGHELALVVLGAARDDPLLAVHLDDRRIERDRDPRATIGSTGCTS